MSQTSLFLSNIVRPHLLVNESYGCSYQLLRVLYDNQYGRQQTGCQLTSCNEYNWQVLRPMRSQYNRYLRGTQVLCEDIHCKLHCSLIQITCISLNNNVATNNQS